MLRLKVKYNTIQWHEWVESYLGYNNTYNISLLVRYIGDNIPIRIPSRNILQPTRSFYDFRFESYSSKFAWFLICLTLTFQGHLIFVNSPFEFAIC